MEFNSKFIPSYYKSNVYIHPSKDESILGTIYILKEENLSTTFLAWTPQNSSEIQDNNLNCGISQDLYSVKIPLSDVGSIKRYIPTIGIPHIIVITKSGIAFPPFHFHDGGVKEFFYELQSFVSLVRSDEDLNVFYLQDSSINSIPVSNTMKVSKPKEIKVIENASWTILEGFSMVTRLARNATSGKLLKDIKISSSPSIDRPQAQSDIGNFELLISREELPKIDRLPELSDLEWKAFFDEQGKITDPQGLRRRIFYGGVKAEIRKDVWKFLLNYYPFSSTNEERNLIDKEAREKYARWKNLYLAIDNEKELKFTKFKLRQHAVEKDVLRTDRTIEYYKGDNNSNLIVLDLILNIYCFFNSDLGYVQGMNELASPILFVMEDEVDSFWCFKKLMDFVESNFHKDQIGMHKQITQLSNLVKMLIQYFINISKNMIV